MTGPMPRTPDFLHRHADISNRVRNLETGVHPTTSDNNYFDELGPVNLDIRTASAWNPELTPRWQRRAGTIMLSGSLRSGSAPSGEDHFATVPKERGRAPSSSCRFPSTRRRTVRGCG